MHVEPPCEQGVASTDRTWGGPSGRLTGASMPTRVSPAEYSWPFLSQAHSPLSIAWLIRAPICAARRGRAGNLDPSQLTGCPTPKHQSLVRDPRSWSDLRCALNTRRGTALDLLRLPKNGRRALRFVAAG